MLSYFEIKNFKSIIQLKLDLSFAEGKAPNGYQNSTFLPFVGKKKRYVPTLVLFGANASGKTNIIKGLNAFKTLLLQGTIAVGYFPNKLNTKYNTTTFEIGICLNNKEYSYELEYNETTIVSESLKCRDNNHILFNISNKEQHFDSIATKEYTTQRLREIYKVECQNERGTQWLPFLTCLSKNYKGLNKIISSLFAYILKDLEVYPINNLPLPFGLQKLAKIDTPEAITNAFDKITSLLRKLDVDIDKMTLNRTYHTGPESAESFTAPMGTFLEQRPNNLWVLDSIQSYHKDIQGRRVIFNFTDESEGTQTLSGIIGICLAALEDGKTICIDELERSLHPLLLIEIIKLFKDKRYNKHNAQLIFTAHNTDILDHALMRISEVAILNKTLKTGSTIKRLSDFKDSRNIHNFRKQYLDGVFSGIPYAYI